jgi:biotin transporter BioY
MPATFVHPAAVLPFRVIGKRWFNFTALVIGSVTPDFGYYIRRFDLATYAHSFAGTIVLCLPSGLVAFAIFRMLRAPLCYALPQPHRSALTPLAQARLSFTTRTLVVLCLSVLVGAWTHTIADSCTHKTGWTVHRLPWLQRTLFQIGAADFPVHQLLQHAGSTLGSIALFATYVYWLRRQPHRAPEEPDALRDRTRILLIVLIMLIAVAIALPLGWWTTTAFTGYTRLRASSFQAAIYATQVFIPLFAATAVLVYRCRHRSRDAATLKGTP